MDGDPPDTHDASHHQVQVMVAPGHDSGLTMSSLIANTSVLPTVAASPFIQHEQRYYREYFTAHSVLDNVIEDLNTGHYRTNLKLQRQRGRHTGVVNRKKQAAAERKKMDGPSKAARFRAEKVAQFGEHMIASDGELKGVTRPRLDGYVDWFEQSTSRWLPAAPHDSFREEFIFLDSRKAPYLNPPDRGYHELDVTSNCEVLGQNVWQFDKQGFSEIVDEKGNKVGRLDKQPANLPQYPDCNYLYHNGMVMLDSDDRPVLDWACIPLTFSSRLEGGRMEALRRVFPWLRLTDFRARMPRNTMTSHGEFIPLTGLSTFSQRMIRFRNEIGCSAWIERMGTKAKNLKRKRCGMKEKAESAQDAKSEEGKPSPRRYAIASASKKQKTSPYVSLLTLEEQQHIPHSTISTCEVREQCLGVINCHDLSTRANTGSPLPQDAQIGGQLAELTIPQAAETTIPQQYPCPTLLFSPLQEPSPDYVQVTTPRPLNTDISEPNFSYHSPGGISHLVEQDFRFEVPKTLDDEFHIRCALRLTRADFTSVYGFGPPMLDFGACYNEHYQFIHRAHAMLWAVDDSPPPLAGIKSWPKSFADWEAPVLGQDQLKRLLLSSVFDRY